MILTKLARNFLESSKIKLYENSPFINIKILIGKVNVLQWKFPGEKYQHFLCNDWLEKLPV